MATIGNFDGVHRGHQAIIHQLSEASKAHRLPSTVILFEPQPKEYFADLKGVEPPLRLQRMSEKVRVLSRLGVDRVLCVHFSEPFRLFTREDFVEGFLVNRLGIKHLIVGDDFRFGHDRTGDFGFLTACAGRYKFDLESTPTVNWKGARISSTAVRNALTQNELTLANSLLGRPFSLSGRVIHGRKLGRSLGFPTANIHHQRHRLPMTGVFLVEVDFISSHPEVHSPLSGVANLGYKPSIQGKSAASLEVHLLLPEGQSIDCYHHRVEVHFLKKIRDERKFDSLEALQRQVQDDIAAAKAAFSSQSLGQN